MIDPKEIRIGNYLYREGQPDMVTGIFHEMWGPGEVNVIQAKNKLDYRIDKFEPISLSPAILEKFGFEKETEVIYTIKSIDIMLYVGNGYVDLYLYSHPIKKDIKYLHKLQNIIYENTDTELTITL